MLFNVIKNLKLTSKTVTGLSKSHYYCQYFSMHYKLIVIDLKKQIELENPDLEQQINFIGRLETNGGAATFFLSLKSQKKQLLNLSKMLQQFLDFDLA